MTGKVAILSPNIGTPSETFIRRHYNYLPARKTVALTHNVLPPEQRSWSVDCPIHLIRGEGLFSKGFRYLRHRMGQDVPVHVDVQEVKRFLNEHEVGTVWGHFANYSWPFIRIAEELGVRLFIHALGYDMSKVYRESVWRSRYADYKNASGVIVLNKVMKERLLSVGVPENKIHIIPCGVEVPEIRVVRKPDGYSTRCLAVGRMVGKKAPLKLLEAFRLAAVQNPGLYLDYVGTGPLFETAQNYVRRNHLESRVAFHGGQSHQIVLNMMQKSDLFLQHSLTDPDTGDEEGMPVAILEAMAQGLPVVSTNHAGIPEAVIDDTTGYIVEEGDVETMAQRIGLLADAPQKRIEMGERGWNFMRENFSWQREKARLFEVMGFKDLNP